MVQEGRKLPRVAAIEPVGGRVRSRVPDGGYLVGEVQVRNLRRADRGNEVETPLGEAPDVPGGVVEDVQPPSPERVRALEDRQARSVGSGGSGRGEHIARLE